MKEVNANNENESTKDEGHFSALILAAGNSGRMGTDKALLIFEKNKTFCEYLVEQFIAVKADPVILVVNENIISSCQNFENSTLVLNREVSKGRSHSIRLGLEKVPYGSACFIQNVDNPYANAALYNGMLSVLQPNQYVVPIHRNKGGHPVLLSHQIIDFINALGAWNDFRAVLGNFSKVELPWKDERILLNINTLEEYDKLLNMKQL